MAEIRISLKNLSVDYDGKALIRDISLDIQRGEIVTLIGPNGSGKSTILKTLSRQLQALAGMVILDGRALQSLSGRQLAEKMALVLTDRIRPELMTCWDVAASGRYPYTGRLGILSHEDEEKVERALAMVDALSFAHRSFSAVSDGQRQRILLARAICQEPRIIVLDEPTSFLDIRYKLELLATLRRMAKEEGITVVMSLHEIDLAQKISDRIVCVQGDAISQCGAPEEVFRRGNLHALYGIEPGAYDPAFGNIELPPPKGNPEVLVLSSGGTEIPVYRRLQRQNIPFRAAILYTNDVDYHLARLLAAEVATEAPFCPIGDESYARARAWIHASRCIINAGGAIGPCNRRMRALLAEAAQTGRLKCAESQ